MPTAQTKRCSSCSEDLPLGEFHKKKSSSDGLAGQCKKCVAGWAKEYRENNKEKIAEWYGEYRKKNKEKITKRDKNYSHSYYHNNKEKILEKSKDYYKNNKEKIAEHGKNYRENNKEKIAERQKEYQKNNKEQIAGYQKEYRKKNKNKIADQILKRKYNLSIEDWKKIFNSQNKCCAICKNNKTGLRGFVVDHNHQSGKVRAILCDNCNKLLGHAKDSPSVCRLAAEYLEKWGET